MTHARPTPALLWLPTLVWLQASPALAAPPPAAPPPASTPATAPPTQAAEANAATDDAASSTQREAEHRRDRALELYDEGAFDAALLEFQRAYELAPSYRLLFNLAIVSIELHDDAGAMTFFERYLEQGGKAISSEERAAVATQLQELATNVAWVHVDVNVTGAIVLVDDRQVGTTPLPAPLRINAGLRRISARAGAHLPDSRLLELAGGDHATLALVLVEPTPPPPPPIPPEPSSNVPWLAWGVTAALAGGAVWSGLHALAAQRDYEDALGQLGTTRSQLDQLDRTASRYSIAADALAIAALGAGGYALYLTLDTPDEPSDARPPTASTRIQLWPGGAYLRGEF